MTEHKNGAGQCFALLFLSRAFTVVVWLYQHDGAIDGNTLLWGELLGFLMQLIALLPLYLFLRRSCDAPALTNAIRLNRPLGVVFAILCAVTTLLFGILSMSSFVCFLVQTAFASRTAVALFLVMAVVIVYGVVSSLESIARTGVLVFFFCAASLLFVMATLIPQVNLTEIHPVAYDSDILQIALQRFGSGGELLCILLLAYPMQGMRTRWMAGFLLGSFALLFGLDFLMLTVMGDYVSITNYPIHTLASIAEFSIFQRLDAFHMTVWIFMGSIKTVLYFSLTSMILRELFPSQKCKCLPYLAMAVGLCCSLILCLDVTLVWKLQNLLYSGVAVILTVFLFPLVFWMLRALKKKKEGCR